MQEEAEIAVPKELVTFAGILTWEDNGAAEDVHFGTYMYLVDTAPLGIDWAQKAMKEGTVAWMPLSFAIDKDNKKIAPNLPYFLPAIFQGQLRHFHSIYDKGEQVGFEEYQLPVGLQPHRGH